MDVLVRWLALGATFATLLTFSYLVGLALDWVERRIR